MQRDGISASRCSILVFCSEQEKLYALYSVYVFQCAHKINNNVYRENFFLDHFKQNVSRNLYYFNVVFKRFNASYFPMCILAHLICTVKNNYERLKHLARGM